MEDSIILSTAYLPPIEYFAFLMRGEICLERWENFQKQSYRNRAYIMTGNGRQCLSIPIVNGAGHFPIQDACIDNKTPWQRNHWRSIASAYGNSPYFLYYQDALKPFYEQPWTSLFEYNRHLIQTLAKWMGITCDIALSDDYQTRPGLDLRNEIHPKKSLTENYIFNLKQPYYQVFEDRFGFTPNLSVIDLLFNIGPDSANYLRKLYHAFITLL